MLLTYLMLIVALSLSAIAAFYSIIGLTAIFAAAVVPVAVMGSILEIAKLVVTVWLHEYWRHCKITMKAYLVPAVGILMLVTSMGIFGFLSKAHLDQAVPAGDISAQVSVFDEKIKTQRDNIETARAALRQMDAAVDQTMSRSADEKGAERAVQIRRNQAAERTRLQNDISRAQTEISRLQEQRAPVAAQARKVEAEVGPIKYIAALIYGDNPDTNLLEKAVRWVIIILVVVFDPLAIFMLLAATESYKWEKNRLKSMPNDELDDELDPEPTPALIAAMQSWRERVDKWRKKDADVADVERVTQSLAERPPGDSVDPKPVVEVVAQPTHRPVEYQVLGDADDEEVFSKDQVTHEDLFEDHDDEVVRDAKRRWKSDHPNSTLKEQRRLVATGNIPYEPWLDYLPPDNMQGTFSFGNEWPKQSKKGDLFMRVDIQPTELYKYNGEKWISINKSFTDAYSHDSAYIDHLIVMISQGRYDPELLTDAEREEIEQRLKKDIA